MGKGALSSAPITSGLSLTQGSHLHLELGQSLRSGGEEEPGGYFMILAEVDSIPLNF